MANILFISYDGMTDSLGQSQVLPYLLDLVEKGHEIDILSTEKEANFLKKETQIQKLLQNKISWNYITYTKKPPLLSTIKDIHSLWKKAKILHQKNNYEIIHCRSYIAALIGLKMKRKFQTKFIFDMRGFWADERVDGKIWNLSNPIFKMVYNFFKKKEIDFLENADTIISLTKNAKQKILKWEHFKNQPLKINVIPCCVDMERFDYAKILKSQKTALKESLGIGKDNFVLTYLGSIGTWYMLEEMLDFFKRLIISKPQSKFLFITGENPDYIKTEATKRGISLDYFIIKRIDYTEVPLYLSLSDYAIFFILPVFSKSASSPIKQGEIMSMGIPIVCNAGVGDTDFVINNYNCGLLVKEFNDIEYDKIIDKIENTNFNKKNIREAASDFYSLEKGVNAYFETYKSVL